MSDYIEQKNTYRLSWVNEHGKIVKNWVKQISKDSYWMLRKDGSKMEVKGSPKMLVAHKEDIKSKTPAVMSKTYAQLEVRKSDARTRVGGGSPGSFVAGGLARGSKR